MKFSFLSLCAALGLLVSGVRAEFTLAPLFRDGAVLQRDKPVPVWGTATPGEKIRVQFGTQSVETVADARGSWKVNLASLKASATPAELIVTAGEGKRLRVADVLVGEVWLCSGQSNMGFRVSRSISAKTDVPAANFPLIRQYDVPTVTTDTPQSTSAGTWVTTTPETVKLFTAVGYYFALELHRALGVPVGFIRAAPGGTRIEAWMGAEALASDPAFAVVGERWRESVAGYNSRRAAYENALAAWEADAAEAKAAGRKFEKKNRRTCRGSDWPRRADCSTA
jgi:sialate O-acetylesterase